MNTIFLSKTFNKVIFMFIDSSNKVISNAYVESAMSFTCQYINVIRLHFGKWILAYARMTDYLILNIKNNLHPIFRFIHF